MSTAATRAKQIELEAAQRRVVERLRATSPTRRSPARRAAIVAIAAVLFALAFAARLAVNDPMRCSRTSTSCRSRCSRSSSGRGPG